MAIFLASSTTNLNQASVSISALENPSNNYTGFKVDVYEGSVFKFTHTWTSVVTSKTTTSTISGLKANTTYIMDGYAIWANTPYLVNRDTMATGSAADKTPPKVFSVTAGAEIKAINSYVVKLTWDAEDDIGLSHFWVYYSYANDPTLYSVGSQYGPTTRSLIINNDTGGNTFREGITYYFGVRAIDTSGKISTVNEGLRQLIIPITGAGRPENWEWEYSITSGGLLYPKDGKYVYLMKSAHWNDFVARINSFRVFKLGVNSIFKFNVASTETTSSEITVCINQAIDKINDMLPTGKMARVSPGNVVTAKVFQDMVAKLKLI